MNAHALVYAALESGLLGIAVTDRGHSPLLYDSEANELLASLELITHPDFLTNINKRTWLEPKTPFSVRNTHYSFHFSF